MSIINRSLVVMKMGMRQHEAILSPIMSTVNQALKDGNWTCHKCGVRIPGYMQIDHIKGHGVQTRESLRPICVFCHDQDHIIWAAARKRVVPILGPELTNEQISRLAWSVISLNKDKEDEDASMAVDNLTGAVRQRHHDFQKRYGSQDADSAIEAIFRFLNVEDEETPAMTERKRRIVEKMEAEMRFVPKLLTGAVIEDPSETVSVWRIGGFSFPERTPEEAMEDPGDTAHIISAVNALMAEK